MHRQHIRLAHFFGSWSIWSYYICKRSISLDLRLGILSQQQLTPVVRQHRILDLARSNCLVRPVYINWMQLYTDLNPPEKTDKCIDTKNPADLSLRIATKLMGREVCLERANGVHNPKRSNHGRERAKDYQPSIFATFWVKMFTVRVWGRWSRISFVFNILSGFCVGNRL